jgi:hypothetical protein
VQVHDLGGANKFKYGIQVDLNLWSLIDQLCLFDYLYIFICLYIFVICSFLESIGANKYDVRILTSENRCLYQREQTTQQTFEVNYCLSLYKRR